MSEARTRFIIGRTEHTEGESRTQMSARMIMGHFGVDSLVGGHHVLSVVDDKEGATPYVYSVPVPV
jgi:hypothetical protein